MTQVYPAFGPGKDFTLDWMLLIVARNLLATWLICGFWDWFLYFSPLQVRGGFSLRTTKYVFNVRFQKLFQIFSECEISKTLPGKAGKIQDEPPVPLFQPDQARRHGEKPTIHGPRYDIN